MNHKTLLIVVLSLTMLAGAVAVGIHVLHKDAYAINHVVWVKNITDPENPEFPEGIPMIIRVETAEGVWEDDEGVTDETGKFASSLQPIAGADPGADHWVAEIEIFGFHPTWGDNPRDVNYPSFTTFFDIEED